MTGWLNWSNFDVFNKISAVWYGKYTEVVSRYNRHAQKKDCTWQNCVRSCFHFWSAKIQNIVCSYIPP